MRCVSAKSLLTADQKDAQVSVAQDLLECTKNYENFTKTIVMGDESWVYGYDPETKA